MKNLIKVITLLFLPMLLTAQTITMNYVAPNAFSGPACAMNGLVCDVAIPPNSSPQQIMFSNAGNWPAGCPTVDYSDGINDVKFSGCASPVNIAKQSDGSTTYTFTIDNLKTFKQSTSAFIGLTTGSYAVNVGNTSRAPQHRVMKANGLFDVSPATN